MNQPDPSRTPHDGDSPDGPGSDSLRARQHAAVAELGVRALGGPPLATLLQEAADVVRRTLDTEFVKILELLPDGETARLVAGVGWHEGVVGEATISVGRDSQAGYALLSHEPVVVEELATDPRLGETPLLREHGVVSGMSVILYGPHGRSYGVLGAHTARRRRFSEDDVHVLQGIANVLSAALHRQHVEDDLRRAHAEAEAYAAQLQEQAAELEAQTEEAQSLAEELEQANAALLQTTHDAERARQEAEQANRAKSDFLAVMSHELRTPLNAIGGYAELLTMGLRGAINDAQRLDLERIQRSQRHLLGLINDVLNFARLESGRVEFDMQPVLVADVVRDIWPMVEPLLRAKGLAFDVRLPEGAGESAIHVWADREKLGQVLLNLLSNAVKFTAGDQRGTPATVAVEFSTRTADGSAALADRAYLHVRDTGVGIPAARLDAIFEPFVQIRSELTRQAGGTGLGLAISRDLARGMSGDLTVTSVEGEGSTFTIALRRVPSLGGGPLDRRAGEERRVEVERRSGDDRRDSAGEADRA